MSALTDRELLELAAKAAGLHVLFEDGHFWIGGPAITEQSVWNPLVDDGDRYRLAKKLDIRIHFGPAYVTYAVNGVSGILRWPEDVSDDSYAIVRAAAEIGKAVL